MKLIIPLALTLLILSNCVNYMERKEAEEYAKKIIEQRQQQEIQIHIIRTESDLIDVEQSMEKKDILT